jgi:monovalent cation/proton antiporter MnhG/PhaG subunit
MAVIREIITDGLLALAVLTVAAASLGVAVMPDAYARLHYVTPAAVVAPLFVTLAIFVREGFDENTGETVVALVFMVAAAPFLSHATIRAMRVRDRGDWRQPRQQPRQPSDGQRSGEQHGGEQHGGKQPARESR